MTTLIRKLGVFHAAEKAQDTFEYLLVIGVLVVAVVGAVTVLPGLVGTVQDLVVGAVTGLFS